MVTRFYPYGILGFVGKILPSLPSTVPVIILGVFSGLFARYYLAEIRVNKKLIIKTHFGL